MFVAKTLWLQTRSHFRKNLRKKKDEKKKEKKTLICEKHSGYVNF